MKPKENKIESLVHVTKEYVMSLQRVTRIIAFMSFVCLMVVAAPAFSHASNSADEGITGNVQQALKGLNRDITVKTVDGKVYLRGHVAYAEDANEAEWLARRVPGVRSVNTDIAYDQRRDSN